MSNMIVAELHPIAAIANTGIGGSGVDNLITPEPKEVWIGNAAGDHGIFYVDLGAEKEVDFFFLGGVRALGTVSGQWEISTATGLAPGGEAVINALQNISGPGGQTEPFPGFVRLAAPVTGRYFRIKVVPGTGLTTIGILGVGLAFQPGLNREKGGGRTIIDTGAVESRADGGFGTGHGVVKGGFRWTFGDLSDAEIERLYRLSLRRGNRKPIVVVEDPDATVGLNDRVHYGLFDRFDFYERGDPSKHRWALSVTQWV